MLEEKWDADGDGEDSGSDSDSSSQEELADGPKAAERDVLGKLMGKGRRREKPRIEIVGGA